VIEILEVLEASGFSMWVKESSTAYVSVLAFHTIGLVFLVGISGATAMRVLGAARSMPLEPMQDFFPLMYAGLLMNIFTGLILFCLYPTNYVVDASFYLKLAAIVGAAVTLRKLRALLFESAAGAEAVAETKQAKVLATVLLAAWLAATTAGRLTAYTVPTKLATTGAVVVFMTLALLIGYAIAQLTRWMKSNDSEPLTGSVDH
jgi:hypothetical protein